MEIEQYCRSVRGWPAFLAIDCLAYVSIGGDHDTHVARSYTGS